MINPLDQQNPLDSDSSTYTPTPTPVKKASILVPIKSVVKNAIINTVASNPISNLVLKSPVIQKKTKNALDTVKDDITSVLPTFQNHVKAQAYNTSPKQTDSLDNTSLGKGANFVNSALQKLQDPTFTIPAGYNAIKEFGQAVLHTATSIADSVAGIANPNKDFSDVPVPTNLQKIYGTDKIKDAGTSVLDMEKSIRESPTAQKLGLDKHASSLAFAGVVGDEFLNTLGIGYGNAERSIGTLVKETNPAEIIAHLINSGIDSKIATKFAPEIAATNDPKEVKSILDIMKGTESLKNLTELEQAKQTKTKEGNPPQEGATPVISNPLDTEVSETIPVDHSRPLTPGEAADGNGVEIAKYAKANGYDAVKLAGSEGELRVVNPNVLNTPKELEDLYTQATKEASKKNATAGTVYHGTKGDIQDITKSEPLTYGDSQALYGPGTYLTDSKDIAEGYAKTKGVGAEGKVLSGNLRGDLKFLDLDKPLGATERKEFENALNSEVGDLMRGDEVLPDGITGAEAVQRIRENLAESGATKSEAAEIFHGLQQNLGEMHNYDGFAHIGGVDKGTPHNVKILFDYGNPEKKIASKFIPQTSKEVEKDGRSNLQLEKMALNARNFDDFTRRSGVTEEVLDSTAKSKGYDNAKEFFDETRLHPPVRLAKAASKADDISYEPTYDEVATRSLEDSAAVHGNTIDPTIEEQFARRDAQRAVDRGIDPGTLTKNLVKAPDSIKTPITELGKIPKEDVPGWAATLRGYSKNLPKAERVHLFDYVSTPEFVLEKLGLQKGAEMLHDAQDIYRTNKKIEIGKILDWKKEVEDAADRKPHSSIRIFRYLDGDARYAKHEMTGTEIKVAGEIKAYLKDWAKRLGLPEENQLSNYITHLFDKEAVDLPTESAFDDPDLHTIMESTPARSVYNPFLEKRTNKPGYKEDVWASLDAYVKRATRKEAMDPALENISDMARKLDGASYEYVTKLTHQINMRPQTIDTLVDNFIKDKVGNRFTERPTAYLSKKFRNVYYRGMLGLNVRSAIKNLSQGANTYAKLGEKHTVIGYTKLFGKLITRNLDELYAEHILDDALDQDRKVGVYKSFLQKADPYLFSLFDMAEKINRGAAYYGAKSKFLSENTRTVGGQLVFKNGVTMEDAIKYAKRIVRETQFAFGAVDAPILLGGDVGKTALQLGSFSLKQGEFFKRMLQNKEYMGLARWSVASVAFLYSIGRIFGMKPEELIPSIGLGGSPVGNLVSGLTEMTTGFNQQQKDEGKDKVSGSIIGAIPAGIQARKTIQGLEAYNAGKDVTATGRTRFNVKHTPENAIRAVLFGKSGLPEAQAYYTKLDNKGKTTKKKTNYSL